MRYLQNTLSETLRLYPVVPFNVRLALKDTTLPRGGGADGLSPIGILKDTPIGYSTLVMQRREDLYPENSDHLVFRPERWESWQPKPWQYIPFNGGPRICIGQQFALTELGYTIVRLLQRLVLVPSLNFLCHRRYVSGVKGIDCYRYDGLTNFMHPIDGGNPCLKAEIVLQPGQGVRVGFHEREGYAEEKFAN